MNSLNTTKQTKSMIAQSNRDFAEKKYCPFVMNGMKPKSSSVTNERIRQM
jgi:hypothetical protein